MRRRDLPLDPEVQRGLRELDAALAAEPAADPDLALLVADVRAARPEADPAFLAALDAKVHAGFAAPGAAPRRRAAWLRPGGVLFLGAGGSLAALLVVVIALAGGGGGTGGEHGRGSASVSSSTASALSSESASSPESAAAAPQQAAEDSSASKSAPAPAGGTETVAPQRRVERSVSLALTPPPDEVQDVADGVVRETQAAGGYVASSSVATSDDQGSAHFVLRIPSAHLDDALARLSKLAHVGSLTQASQDITATFTSAAERLADARAERTSLLRALGRATTDRQIATLKARLAENRSEISRRKGDLAAVARRADLATVQVDVQGTGRAGQHTGGGWTPGDALHDAGRVLEVSGGIAVVAGAVLAPLAVLAALALAARGAARRRRRETALDQAI